MRGNVVAAIVVAIGAYIIYRMMMQGGSSASSLFATAPDAPGDFANAFVSGISAISPVTDFGDALMSSSSSTNPTIQDWASAIAKVESGGNPNALSYRNNNPGNLTPINGGWTGQVGTNGPFAVFDSLQSGWDALYADLQHNVNKNPNWTLTNFFAHYLGNPDPLHPQVTDQGNPFTYAQSVAGQLGVSPDATLGSLFGG